MSGFSVRLRERMQDGGIGVAELATRANVSRQAIYGLLRPDYDPISPGVRKVARALNVDPVDLLPRENDPAGHTSRILDVLRLAAGRKDARAFEVLPALLAGLDEAALATLRPVNDTETRLLGAALAMAAELTGRSVLRTSAEALRRNEDPHQAIFFGGRRIDFLRAVEQTPDALRRHGVFGILDMELFRRHLGRS